jgi:hypothetical protein
MMENERVFGCESDSVRDDDGASHAAVDGRGICNPWDQDTPVVNVLVEGNEESVPYSVDMLLSLFLVAS